jgi:hypothetical protein
VISANIDDKEEAGFEQLSSQTSFFIIWDDKNRFKT